MADRNRLGRDRRVAPNRTQLGRNRTEVADLFAGSPSVVRGQTSSDALQEAKALGFADVVRGKSGLSRPSTVSGDAGFDVNFNDIKRFGLETLQKLLPFAQAGPGTTYFPERAFPTQPIPPSGFSLFGFGGGDGATHIQGGAFGPNPGEIIAANVQRENRRASNQDILEGALQRFNQQAYAPYAAEINRLQGEYGSALQKLQNDLAKYKGGLAGVNKAYTDYAADADAILKQAASIDAEALPDTEVVEKHQEVYDQHDTQMQAALLRIDTSGSPELAQAMSDEIRNFESVMENGLRSGLISQEELHTLAGAEAQAVAHMTWKNDAYNAEKERYGLELEIQAKINAQAEAIAANQEAMARSMQAVRDQWQATNLDPGQIWDLALGDLVGSKGFNDIQSQDIIDTFNSAFDPSSNPGAADALNNYDSYRGWIQYVQNLELLSHVGGTQLALAAIQESPELQTALESGWLTSASLAAFGFDESGFDGGLQAQISGMKEETDLLLDLWGHYSDFTSNPEQYSQVDPTGFLGAEVAWNEQGDKAFPVMGFNWGSGGGFGYIKPSGRRHEGVDIGGYRGTPIVAPVQGTVVREGWNDMGGWTVTIKDATGFTHYLAHMDQRSPVRVGQTIPAGQYVGGVGNSGNASGSAPHVHYGMRDSGGNPVNPAPWLGTTGAWRVGDPPSDARTNVFTYNSAAPGGAVNVGDVLARFGIGG